MSDASHAGQAWPDPLAGRVTDSSRPDQVAEAIASVWHDIDEALHPIIGRRGAAALYQRCLSLTAKHHPWLAQAHEGVLDAVDSSLLKSTLAAQSAAEAAACGRAMFETFHTLLASLVGPSLTARMLRPVWVHPAGEPPAQDTAP